ncbi:MAG: DNA repair protein RadC [Dysgonamonadaceae bacterium]|jgi:DNA repair protein RadC|nr:DNA repair protein RadC [Dysgonamonadaceae bacterium]
MSVQFKLSVKELSPEDQPREKLLMKGVDALSNAELLAIIIGSGNRDETSVELSQRILKSVSNNINGLGKLSVKHLISNFKGIGEAKAISIVAALELGKRRKFETVEESNIIISSKQIYQYFERLLCDIPYEEFWALFMNNANRIIGRKKISQGGVSEASVDIKLVFHEAVTALASKVIICHNHPSGNIQPSIPDDNLTSRIQTGMKSLGIQLIDHVIVSDGCYYSYSDENRILNTTSSESVPMRKRGPQIPSPEETK